MSSLQRLWNVQSIDWWTVWLTLTYKDGNGMNALIRWPDSWCSVFVETRSISGLSPYNNNNKTAERRASCEPRLQFIRPGVAVARTSIRFIQKRRTPPTVTFVPGIPSALYYWLFLFYRGLNSFFFFFFKFQLTPAGVFASRALR